MASRLISDCRPDLQEIWAYISRVWQETYPDLPQPVLICTARSNEEQDKDYAQGRTTPGHIITNAQAGQSPHNTVDENGNLQSSAIDIMFVKDKKAVWGLGNYILLNRLLQIKYSHILVWGGGFSSLKDNDHWELRDWKQYKDKNRVLA